MDLTYNNYLKIDELLNLQQRKSQPAEHDEMLFIIIHQTYELWFKQILHEFGKLRTELEQGNTWTSLKTTERVLTILKIMVAQLDILETMTPKEFISFRDFLDNASGFQSVQFREMEILCGYNAEHAFITHKNQPEYVKRLKDRMKEPTLWESFCKYLQEKGYSIPEPKRSDNGRFLYAPSGKAQKILINIVRSEPKLALLIERFVDFDEGLQEWRYRHVKMVERTIGDKQGTGGSSGVEYLRKTLHRRIFPDLWAIRSEL
jgi:tryptophan 2,3-dioxygenase